MNWYRILHFWSDLKMYTRHIYRRVRHQWFCRNILVKVPNLKMYRYTDIDAVITEVNFHLLCSFVERERFGAEGLKKDIAWLTHEIEEGPLAWPENKRDWYSGEKEVLQHQLDSDRQILEIYTYLQERKNREETYWDLSLEEQDKIDEEETNMLIKIVSLRRHLWT